MTAGRAGTCRERRNSWVMIAIVSSYHATHMLRRMEMIMQRL